MNLPSAMRVVHDPIEGDVLLVGGSAPFIVRIIGARTLTTFRCEDIKGVEWVRPGTLWPSMIPSDMLGSQTVAFVPCHAFRPVDLLYISYGSRRFRNEHGDVKPFYFANEGGAITLGQLDDWHARALLVDEDFRRKRGDDLVGLDRALRLGD